MIENLLRAALGDAGVLEDTTVLFLVSGEPPDAAAEYAYLPPGHWDEYEHRVLYDAGPRLGEFHDFHRFAAYAEPAGAPEGGIAVGLRHESEHAAQFNQHGPDLFALESILRLAMRRAARMNEYTQIPSERDANRAAGEYARARYSQHVEAMAADERFRHFVAEPERVASLVDETVETIWQYANPNEIDEQDDDDRPFATVVPELKQGALSWTPIDPQYRTRRSDDQPFVVQIQR